MKILIVTIGSRGDINPYIAVGRELKKRGHEVLFSASGYFQELAEASGLPFIPHLGREAYLAGINDPDLWNFRKALPTFSRVALIPALRKIYSIIERERTDDFLLLSSPFAFASRVAEEKLGIKLVQLHLSPSQFRTFDDTAQLAGIPMNRYFPGWFKSMVWYLVDKFVIYPFLGRELNRFRKEVGLEPVGRLMNGWWFSRRFNAMVFSELFASRQQGWPEPARIFNFLCFDGYGEISDEAETFLRQGSPPVVFTPGTAFMFGKTFFKESLAALTRLKTRGIFLAPDQASLPEHLPKDVYAAGFLPLGTVLPRCAAIVHHGGIGTLAQALKAGVPQIVRPMAFDQFDNGYRLHQKKLGTCVPVRQYTSRTLRRKLEYVLNDSTILANCKRISKSIDSEKALQNLVSSIETC